MTLKCRKAARPGRGGFTIIELMTVLGVVAMLMGAFVTSVAGAQKRSKTAKAEAEVAMISQAILAYENFGDLPTISSPRPVDDSTLGFLLKGGSSVPVLLQAALSGGKGEMLDPWNHPYKVTIRPGSESVKIRTASSSLQTGYSLPNFYRLSKEERE